MERFFARPTPEKTADYIYCQIIATHESGGRGYRYLIPQGMSISFVNQVIDRLSELLLDVDIIELNNGYIVVDWS
jgi:hypothetical protein